MKTKRKIQYSPSLLATSSIRRCLYVMLPFACVFPFFEFDLMFFVVVFILTYIKSD